MEKVNKKENFKNVSNDKYIRKNLRKKELEPIKDLPAFLKEHYWESNLIILDDHSLWQTSKPLIVAVERSTEVFGPLKKYLDILHSVAMKFKGRIQYGISSKADFELTKDISDWGQEAPPYIYAIDQNNRMFDKDGFFTVEELVEYSEKLLSGELYKSEPIPNAKEAENSLIKTAVGDNFEEIISGDTDKDILLFFYASWCCISTKLLPVLDVLSKMLKNDKILFVKMKGEVNYIPMKFSVYAYPRIIILPKDNRNILIEYNEGEQNLENLLKFVAANATDELKLYTREGILKENSLT